MSMDREEFIAHYGVKGMKWGKRKGGVSTRKPSKDHKTASKIKQKHLSEMSNDDLQKLNQRQQLEKKYKDLNPSTVSKGAKKAAALLAVIGTVNALISLPSSPGGKLVSKGVVKTKQFKNRNQLSIGK